MNAAESVEECGTSAAPVKSAVLRDAVFIALTAAQGARNDTERARLLKMDRATVSRMRKRRFLPRLENAMRMAEVLGTTVDELFEQVSA